MVGGAKSHLESNPIPTRDAQRAQTKPCVHQDPETPQRVSQTCLWVFECLLWRRGSAVTCCGDRGSGCTRSGSCSVWDKPSCRRSPLAPPYRHLADDPQTAEQLYQRNSLTVKKVLGPTTDFPTWGSSKGPENPQGIWLWRPVGFDYRTSTGLGKQTLGGHRQNLMCTRSHEKGRVSLQETEPDLPVSVQESPVEVWVHSTLNIRKPVYFNFHPNSSLLHIPVCSYFSLLCPPLILALFNLWYTSFILFTTSICFLNQTIFFLVFHHHSKNAVDAHLLVNFIWSYKSGLPEFSRQRHTNYVHIKVLLN